MNKLVGLPAKTVQRRYYPVIVMFEDINDPTTLKLVDPDDLDWTLGCSIPTDEAKPWRAEGLTWRAWMMWHFVLETTRGVASVEQQRMTAMQNPQGLLLSPDEVAIFDDSTDAYAEMVAHKSVLEDRHGLTVEINA